MSTPRARFEQVQWDEFVRLNCKSSLLTLGLAALVLLFHKGFDFQRPGLFETLTGLAVIYFGLMRYILSRALTAPNPRKKPFVFFFKIATLAQALAWAAMINALSAWHQDQVGPTLLAILLMAVIPASAASSLHLQPRLYVGYLLGFFGGTLGYFFFVGGHIPFPYLAPVASCWALYLLSLAKTQRKLTERLIESQAMAQSRNDIFKTILDESPMMFALCSAEGRFQYANRSFEEFYGVSIRELTGASLQRTLKDEVSLTSLRDFIGSQKIHTAEEVTVRKEDKEHKFWSVFRRSPDATQVLAYWVDVSPYETHRSDQIRKELESTERKKFQMLSEFSEHLFRELNPPLAQIWNIAKNLERSPLADKIDFNIQKLVRLSKSLRSMANLKTQESRLGSEGFRIGELVTKCVNSVKPRFQSDTIALEVQIPEPETFVLGSLLWIEHILDNLLVNAADALAGQQGAWVKVEVSRVDDAIEIWVKDSGKALGPSMREKIFEPFFTTKEPGEGMGMGLSLSRELALRCEGNLVFKETPEGYNGFALVLKSLVAAALGTQTPHPKPPKKAA